METAKRLWRGDHRHFKGPNAWGGCDRATLVILRQPHICTGSNAGGDGLEVKVGPWCHKFGIVFHTL
jgi:hypothetical protein